MPSLSFALGKAEPNAPTKLAAPRGRFSGFTLMDERR